MSDQLEQLVRDLESTDSAQRLAAAQRLCHLGPAIDAAAVPLVRAVADSSEEVREWATAALEESGPPRVENIGELAALAADQSADVAYWAVTLLGRSGERAAAVVDDLAKALATHPAMTVRQRAAWALGKVGSSAELASDALQAAAKNDDPRLARLAANALRKLGME